MIRSVRMDCRGLNVGDWVGGISAVQETGEGGQMREGRGHGHDALEDLLEVRWSGPGVELEVGCEVSRMAPRLLERAIGGAID